MCHEKNKQKVIMKEVPNNSKKKMMRKSVRTDQLTISASDAHI